MKREVTARVAPEKAQADTLVESELTAIKYIGHRQEYKDGACGTDIVFKHGQTRMVPKDAAGRMLAHKDVYVLGETVLDIAPVKVADKSDEEASQAVRDQVSFMDKTALASFAKTNFSVELDRKDSVSNLRQQVTGMVDRFGVR